MEPEFLKNIAKEGPFETPEAYFAKLHKEIMGKVRREEGMPFEVPPAYFDLLPARISLLTSGLAEPVSGTAAGHAAYRRMDHYIKTAVAACFALLLGILGILQVEKKNEADNSFVNISNFDEEILVQEYLETYLPDSDDESGEMETYILNQVDESLLLQEL
ncbi:hypothetical protein EDD80_101531 [Anseongella ginsenosidimutans]|uniref:Uncharacterized protein n=1 Tax=Anseongella ginsenosidimutans TaxID=496056 RepID=A0A4R3KY29_9SPHI|nr:hypothetical protein [Anseongella ginsenosidimutans]QEC51017.1 hypothetical protein FRZ59_00720 [Anseongella ginsenosidimutans]TCS90331.1 hypothetical protein EDD80_101531 [Anseongella ginsenosidimutans]